MLGARGYHRGFGDGDACVRCKNLALFLFPCINGQREDEVDADVELCEVIIEIWLADLCVCCHDVCDEFMQTNAIEPINWIV